MEPKQENISAEAWPPGFSAPHDCSRLNNKHVFAGIQNSNSVIFTTFSRIFWQPPLFSLKMYCYGSISTAITAVEVVIHHCGVVSVPSAVLQTNLGWVLNLGPRLRFWFIWPILSYDIQLLMDVKWALHQMKNCAGPLACKGKLISLTMRFIAATPSKKAITPTCSV